MGWFARSDYNVNGLKQGTSWLKGDDAWVVSDKDGNGTIDSGRELLGDEFYEKSSQISAYILMLILNLVYAMQ